MPTGARLARSSDAHAIAVVQQRAWRAQFTGLLPDDVLAALDTAELAAAWGEAIIRPPSAQHRVLVAVDGSPSAGNDTAVDGSPSAGDRVIGYAAIGPDDTAGADRTAELLDLVIDPDAIGQGHGSRLMQAAVDHLRGAGFETVVIWIPVDDSARRRFLESAGWGPDGAFRDLDAQGTPIRQVRLVTDISAPA